MGNQFSSSSFSPVEVVLPAVPCAAAPPDGVKGGTLLAAPLGVLQDGPGPGRLADAARLGAGAPLAPRANLAVARLLLCELTIFKKIIKRKK